MSVSQSRQTVQDSIIHSIDNNPFDESSQQIGDVNHRRSPIRPMEVTQTQPKNEYDVMCAYDDILTDLLIDSVHLDFRTEKMCSGYYCKSLFFSFLF